MNNNFWDTVAGYQFREILTGFIRDYREVKEKEQTVIETHREMACIVIKEMNEKGYRLCHTIQSGESLVVLVFEDYSSLIR